MLKWLAGLVVAGVLTVAVMAGASAPRSSSPNVVGMTVGDAARTLIADHVPFHQVMLRRGTAIVGRNNTEIVEFQRALPGGGVEINCFWGHPTKPGVPNLTQPI